MISAEIRQETGGLSAPRWLPRVDLEPAVSPAKMLENMRSACDRGLPEVRICRPHHLKMAVAGGGPSLADTIGDLSGYVVAINGSLKFLLDNGVVPAACGVLDPGEHIADMLVADPRVRYFVASVCDPSVFDKLKGGNVHLWHPSGQGGGTAEFIKARNPADWLLIGGGCTMGLRWVTLGYNLGFRSFDLHGLDSSFRDGATHAYPDRADEKEHIEVKGRMTRLNFLHQVNDFCALLDRFGRSDVEPVQFSVFGDGLLQDVWRERCASPA